MHAGGCQGRVEAGAVTCAFAWIQCLAFRNQTALGLLDAYCFAGDAQEVVRPGRFPLFPAFSLKCPGNCRPLHSNIAWRVGLSQLQRRFHGNYPHRLPMMLYFEARLCGFSAGYLSAQICTIFSQFGCFCFAKSCPRGQLLPPSFTLHGARLNASCETLQGTWRAYHDFPV